MGKRDLTTRGMDEKCRSCRLRTQPKKAPHVDRQSDSVIAELTLELEAKDKEIAALKDCFKINKAFQQYVITPETATEQPIIGKSQKIVNIVTVFIMILCIVLICATVILKTYFP